MKSILDPAFKYVPSHETDIRKTFARVREEAAALRPLAKQPFEHTKFSTAVILLANRGPTRSN